MLPRKRRPASESQAELTSHSLLWKAGTTEGSDAIRVIFGSSARNRANCKIARESSAPSTKRLVSELMFVTPGRAVCAKKRLIVSIATVASTA